ncbi:hypothetical protein BDY24DRAFT_391705 [Mrakia frigida]|uniref:uncharacterized protein n=1 Tax=Mrakia frigida TaxID=29902 RepID=UPI003FCC1FC3
MLSFTQTLVAGLLFSSSALFVSAAPNGLVHPFSGVVRRQSSNTDALVQQIPASCTSLCNSTLTLYEFCETGNSAQCLNICTTDSLNNMYTCINCAITDGNLTMAEYSSINTTVTTLVSTCSSAGISGTPTASLAPFNSSATSTSNTTTGAAASASASQAGGASSSRVGNAQFGVGALAGVMALVALAL